MFEHEIELTEDTTENGGNVGSSVEVETFEFRGWSAINLSFF